MRDAGRLGKIYQLYSHNYYDPMQLTVLEVTQKLPEEIRNQLSIHQKIINFSYLDDPEKAINAREKKLSFLRQYEEDLWKAPPKTNEWEVPGSKEYYEILNIVRKLIFEEVQGCADAHLDVALHSTDATVQVQEFASAAELYEQRLSLLGFQAGEKDLEQCADAHFNIAVCSTDATVKTKELTRAAELLDK